MNSKKADARNQTQDQETSSDVDKFTLKKKLLVFFTRKKNCKMDGSQIHQILTCL